MKFDPAPRFTGAGSSYIVNKKCRKQSIPVSLILLNFSFIRIISLKRQTIQVRNKSKGVNIMKATGIVRRIDD